MSSEGNKDDRERAAEEAAIKAFEPGEVEPTITLDRYLSKRRPGPRMGWVQIISLVAMLGALIMIMLYKESCGRQISQLMGSMSDKPAAGSALPGVPVKVRLAPSSPASKPAKGPSSGPSTP